MPVPLPPADHEILDLMDEIGWYTVTCNGPAPLPATEILAWCEGMDTSLTPWEFSMVRRLSTAFCNGIAASEAPYEPLIIRMGLATVAFQEGAFK